MKAKPLTRINENGLGILRSKHVPKEMKIYKGYGHYKFELVIYSNHGRQNRVFNLHSVTET